VGFATKPQMARKMIARAIATKLPFAFVATDTVYGRGDIETMLRKAGKRYVLGVPSTRVSHSWGKKQLIGGSAAEIAHRHRCAARKRSELECGVVPRILPPARLARRSK
jgi:SRSO17 transposase